MEAEKRERRILRRKRRKQVIPPMSLPNDILEEIFLLLPFKPLLRLKSLSKQWRTTIVSPSFAERHLKIAELDQLKVMLINKVNPPDISRPCQETKICFRTICLESSSSLSFTCLNFPQRFSHCINVSSSCDGLFCIHSPESHAIYVVNPATSWFRRLPPARFQILMYKFTRDLLVHLAFVKAVDYKLVWLYNSEKENFDHAGPNEGVTMCEVFDIKTNVWRILSCTPSYRLYYDQKPVYANGSIYWFTEQYNYRIKIVTFDIHTEIFRLLPEIKSAFSDSDPRNIVMGVVDNYLCMSIKILGRNTITQDIWKLNSLEDTWEKLFTIDLLSCGSSKCRFTDGFYWSSDDAGIYKNKKIMLKCQIKYLDGTCHRKIAYFQSFISHI